MSQIVQVVSILEVIMRLGEIIFQSSDVIGAVCSGDLELDKRANGDSLAGAWPGDGPVIEFDVCIIWELGKDHRRRWSPDVASKSVDCFCEEGGSHKIRVTGYECVASAVFTYSSSTSPGTTSGVSASGCLRWVSRIWI